MDALDECVRITVVNLADVNIGEILQHVSIAHPESTIIAVDESNCLFQLVGPQVRGIRPIALPFEAAPWVTQQHKRDRVLRLILHSLDADETVGVARDEPGVLVLCFAAFFTEVATSRHDIVLFVKVQQVLLEVSILLIVGHKAVARRSGQVPQSVPALT